VKLLVNLSLGPDYISNSGAHLALNVKDVEASLDFYRKLLGIEPSKVRIGYAKFDVRAVRSAKSSSFVTMTASTPSA
jgi:catechol 2,3-dioxygenase-like lactoylglutathione lyase family enzyme